MTIEDQVRTDGERQGSSPPTGFLEVPESSADVQRLYDRDLEQHGFVMNLTSVWAHLPDAKEDLFALMGKVVSAGGLTMRQRGILVSACASTLGDAYCSLAWGERLAAEAGADVAGSVLRGEDDGLDDAERVLARWARQIARDPNGTEAADVQELRDAGFEDAQIFALTAFVALRIAFSTVNDALGAQPDHELAEEVPAAVREAVTYGRSVARPAR
jgi:uncharacterized peroxidase-related enzyme